MVLGGAVHLAAVVAILHCGTLVIHLLTTGQSYLQLGAAVLVNIEAEGHNGEAGIFELLLQTDNLATIEQEFAVTASIVIVERAIEKVATTRLIVTTEYGTGID